MKKSKEEGIVYRISFFFLNWIKTTNLSPPFPAPRLIIVFLIIKKKTLIKSFKKLHQKIYSVHLFFKQLCKLHDLKLGWISKPVITWLTNRVSLWYLVLVWNKILECQTFSAGLVHGSIKCRLCVHHKVAEKCLADTNSLQTYDETNSES